LKNDVSFWDNVGVEFGFRHPRQPFPKISASCADPTGKFLEKLGLKARVNPLAKKLPSG